MTVPLRRYVNPRYYGRGIDFEGLLELAEAMRGHDARLEPYAEYCELRERGLRSQAFNVLSQFTADFATWPLDERIAFVDWLLELHLRSPNVEDLLPHPVVADVIAPTLDEWIEKCPEDAIPRRWRGIFFHDDDELVEALRLDPGDDLARLTLAVEHLERMNFATHHLPEGFIGHAHEFLDLVDETRTLLEPMGDNPLASPRREELEWYQRLIELWIEYKESDRAVKFGEFCGEHSFDFQRIGAHFRR